MNTHQTHTHTHKAEVATPLPISPSQCESLRKSKARSYSMSKVTKLGFFGLYEKDSDKKLLLTLIGISVRGISILYRKLIRIKQDKSN